MKIFDSIGNATIRRTRRIASHIAGVDYTEPINVFPIDYESQSTRELKGLGKIALLNTVTSGFYTGIGILVWELSDANEDVVSAALTSPMIVFPAAAALSAAVILKRTHSELGQRNETILSPN